MGKKGNFPSLKADFSLTSTFPAKSIRKGLFLSLIFPSISNCFGTRFFTSHLFLRLLSRAFVDRLTYNCNKKGYKPKACLIRDTYKYSTTLPEGQMEGRDKSGQTFKEVRLS